MKFDFIKKKIQDNLDGRYYGILSNIIRSTLLPHKANKKKYFEVNKNLFHPEVCKKCKFYIPTVFV